MATFKAVGDCVIIEVPLLEKETQRDSGIFLIQSDPAKVTTVIGTITSVGEGRFDSKTGTQIKPPVTVGDRIVVNLSTGVSLDDRHRMIRADDIFAVVCDE